MKIFPPIAYVVSRFPHLPETFILREMDAMAELGWPITLYPIVTQHQPVVHDAARRWMSGAVRMPLFTLPVAMENARRGLRMPVRYLDTFRRMLWENRSAPAFLMRSLALFPKAVWSAASMEQSGIAHMHAHYATHPATLAWIVHRLSGIPYSVTVHAHDIFVRKAMLAAKMRDATFVVAISEFNRQYLSGVVGSWVADKTHVIHCGIDPKQYRPRPSGEANAKPYRILSIGSLQPYKGQRYLIEACRILRKRNILIRCTIIGEGEERRHLEKLIQTYRLEEAVRLAGAQTQEQIARMLPEANCYAQPSIITASGKMEGIPVALMEAMACELPVVATAISGIPELVLPEKNGYLVPPTDAPALADCLDHMIHHPSEAAMRANAGRAWVLAAFDLHENVRMLSDIMQRAIQRSLPQE
jgi:colanic acid/amylovoran biosynthesis glycosyltransferase